MTLVAVANQLFVLGSVILFKFANELYLQTPYTVSFLLNQTCRRVLSRGDQQTASTIDDAEQNLTLRSVGFNKRIYRS